MADGQVFTRKDWEMARHWRDNYARAACLALTSGDQDVALENAQKYLTMDDLMAVINKALEPHDTP